LRAPVPGKRKHAPLRKELHVLAATLVIPGIIVLIVVVLLLFFFLRRA
jgi:hypothetical protein